MKRDERGETPTARAIAVVRHRLRALMFGWEFPPFNSGGLGVACLGLTRALAGENLDITFVMPKKLPLSVPFAKMVSAELADLEAAGVTVHAVNSLVIPYASGAGGSASSYAVAPDGTPIYGSDLVAETRRYARFGAVIAAREPHDVIYAHDWLSFGAGREAKRVSGKPLIAHVHATEFDRTGGSVNQAVYDLERAGVHAADRIVAVSHRTKEAVTRHYGVHPQKVSVVWNGIDDATAPAADGVTPARLTALKNAGYKLVLFMGRITLQKGPDYFVRAARRVADRDPDVLFILAGSGDMERQVIREAAALGLADRVLFPGFLRGHDQYEAYALADLYVMPSVSEPFGITALEAMRAGTPVIVSKQSGVAEAAKNILTVDFWDTEKMADLILQVLGSPELHAELSAKGAAEAATLTWERSAREVRGIIDEVVGVPAAV
ncbi:MAG TPA: glycosyltransferase family 4 protein [Candidatus Paceibacterota bacterium]|nr:glycosyltransferase family 4 protein [Candidatus Paceibacterota bacterium]